MGNLKLKREAHNALRQSAVVTWAVGFVASSRHMSSVQGRDIGLELFYTPWHPDDFAMLERRRNGVASQPPPCLR